MRSPHKAVALISGGLDSMLAVRVLQEQGIEVEGINFFTGFCVEGHTHAIRNQHKDKQKRNNALWVAEQLGIKLHIIDVIEEYKDVLLNPKHGYGANMNPCLDCKIFMVKKAVEWVKANHMQGFDFIITGEVIGQRPKSQLKRTMPIVAAESGADDLLLRPLCAKNLQPTKPEREGWVDRSKLYDFHGRNRKPQIALAKQFGFDDFATPAGGCCFLTDESYSSKLVDLWKARNSREYELDDIMLLKVGRHIRPKADFKMIIARDAGESKFLEGYRKQFISLYSTSHNGPMAIIDGDIDQQDFPLAASIVARFGQGRYADEVEVKISLPDQSSQQIQARPITAEQVPQEWYV
ncbi:tRNA (5-methylaminomethyl-2-thiouridylate)-methyltransferase [Methylophaga pinxianii]|uniref:tRNA (5-methylaminomethyl-2-thiouridylate)-methyltransferase n=1 Tax=Methylophaga pinxianii TaxID=2881052 RepID=UPI001CF11320|nr:tRNA (5-methylaminomethyl-2-thiouridylate)-methyltransferase [Methylophaga pinxianii]MCB2425434.1 tRNA (5-methylaminomethyl-2-thiouridylate)-methyltransferase [Methylophaga pinxianii]UPH45227.1 tRNA (5-methylaminomethyl-2-thiouridylate)-methyltransferase [Methylophaga pinxianii]